MKDALLIVAGLAGVYLVVHAMRPPVSVPNTAQPVSYIPTPSSPQNTDNTSSYLALAGAGIATIGSAIKSFSGSGSYDSSAGSGGSSYDSGSGNEGWSGIDEGAWSA